MVMGTVTGMDMEVKAVKINLFKYFSEVYF
jgi:hypothetical protein